MTEKYAMGARKHMNNNAQPAANAAWRGEISDKLLVE
jgi:hypothetical protein